MYINKKEIANAFIGSVRIGLFVRERDTCLTLTFPFGSMLESHQKWDKIFLLFSDQGTKKRTWTYTYHKHRDERLDDPTLAYDDKFYSTGFPNSMC